MSLAIRDWQLALVNTTNSLFSKNEKKEIKKAVLEIARLYYKCREAKTIPSIEFEAAALENRALQKIYNQLVLQDMDKAMQLKPLVELVQTRVQEMNLFVGSLTSQDFRNIMSFFQTPLEKEYLDAQSETNYLVPDHSRLLSFAGRNFDADLYASFGVCRKLRVMNPKTCRIEICDMIFFRKHSDQINYEKKDFFWQTLDYCTGYFQSRISKQAAIAKKVQKSLDLFSRGWGYDSFYMAETEELVNNLNYSREDALEFHGVFLYYKMKIVPNSNVETLD